MNFLPQVRKFFYLKATLSYQRLERLLVEFVVDGLRLFCWPF